MSKRESTQTAGQSYTFGDEDGPSNCKPCNGTGWVKCDHQNTTRDAVTGWCDGCETPGDLEIDGLVEVWCACQPL